MEKTLDINLSDGLKKPDYIEVRGDGNLWQLLCKVSNHSQGLIKSTSAMQLPKGCLVQVSTQQRNPDGSYVVAEAIEYVPGVKVECGQYLVEIDSY